MIYVTHEKSQVDLKTINPWSIYKGIVKYNCRYCLTLNKTSRMLPNEFLYSIIDPGRRFYNLSRRAQPDLTTISTHSVDQATKEMIPPDLTDNSIKDCWYRFLNIIGNPVDICQSKLVLNFDFLDSKSK